MSKAYYENSSKSRSDLYSYTGRVKFFDREKECGSILEIEDAGRSERVVGEWRVTAQHLGNVVLNSGDYVYFMKKTRGVADITPLHMRDLLRKPCHICGRRDYVPGRDFFCSHCGNRLPAVDGTTGDGLMSDDAPAYNCLAGTTDDRP